MAYTYTQLIKAYVAVHGGVEPTPEIASQLLLMTNPSYSDTDRLNYILNSADQSTAVAVLSYQFFTGKSPTAEGIAYLVNSADNATDLNDPIYAKFNLENRFMNFATNLALNGQAKVDFDARYGSMDYAQYVASIYETIVGKSQAAAAGLDPDAIIQSIIGRQDLILLSARNNGVIGPNATRAEIDLALKAATAAYLLAEAIKADVGTYAAGTNNFMLAVAKGDAVYNTDITQTYAPTPTSGSSGKGQAVDAPPPAEDLPGAPPPAEPEPTGNFVLTTGVDDLTGDARDNTFTGTHLTFTDGDLLDGGDGHDTLTVTVTGGATFTPPNDGVKNIETVTINSDGRIISDTELWTGLTQLNTTAVGATILTVHEDTNVTATVTQQGNDAIDIGRGHDVTVTATGATGGSISVGHDVAVTGDVVVSRQLVGNNPAGSITVNGGATVSITQTTAASPGLKQKNGGVVVDGSEATTTVTVKAAPATADIDANGVTIRDIHGGSAGTLAGTIATVSVDGYTTVSFTGTALTDLSLAHGSGNVTLTNSSNGAPAATTLNLKTNGLTGGVLSDTGVYQTLNITTGAEASTLGNISMVGVDSLSIAGDSRLTLTSTAGLSSLETVMISGAGGLTANLSGATVTAIDASGATGANILTLDGAKAAFTGGAGVDTVTLTAGAASRAIALGGGDDRLDLTSVTSFSSVLNGGAGTDTLVINHTQAVDASNAWSTITGFEILELKTSGLRSLTLQKLGDFETFVVSGSGEATVYGLEDFDTLTTVKTAGAAGLTADLSPTTVTVVDTSASTGYSSLVLDGAKTRFTGGAGIDVLGITGASLSQAIALGGDDDTLNLESVTSLTAALDGGAGTDTLMMSTTLAGILSGQTPSITNFETLELDSSGDNTTALTKFADFSKLVLNGSGVSTLSGLASFDNLTTLRLNHTTGLSADLSVTSVTSVDASTASGNNTLTLKGAQTSFTGGSGVDVITVNGPVVSKAISLGNGDDTLDLTGATSLSAAINGGAGDDTLKMSAALAATLAGQTPSISGFEILELNTATAANLGTTLNAFGWATTLAISGAGDVTANLSGAAATAVKTSDATGASTLTIDGSKTSFTGGSGVDQITVTAAAVSNDIVLGGGDDILDLTNATSLSAAIDGGAGDDSLKMTTAFLQGLMGQFPSISSFETLQLTGAGSGALGLDTITSKVSGLTSLVLGSSDDTLDLGNVSSLAVALDGGNGRDTLRMTNSQVTTLSGQTPSISNFEVLGVSGSGPATIDLDKFGGVDTVNIQTSGRVTLTYAGATALTYNGGTSGNTLTLAGGAHDIDLNGSGFGAMISQVTITSAAHNGSTPLFASIEHYHDGDTITLRPASGVGAANGSFGAEISGGVSLEAYLDLAAAGNGGTTSQMTWFRHGGDTYVVLDNSAETTFQTGVDNVVRLVGNFVLENLTVTAGAFTFGPTS